MLVVRLVKEDVFPVASILCGEFLDNSVIADSVLRAELLPKLDSDLVSALTNLKCNDFTGHEKNKKNKKKMKFKNKKKIKKIKKKK